MFAGLAATALRKIQQEIGTSHYPASRKRPGLRVTTGQPRSAVVKGSGAPPPPKKRYVLSGHYVMSARSRHARRQFWVYVAVGVICMIYLIVMSLIFFGRQG